jgi:ADP-L-glycero-D-manno-heptose 6-epimerase
MKKALVTGATGFIGFHLCKKLYQDGYFVIAVGKGQENKPLCHEIYKDHLDELPFANFGQIDICFHQAANNNTLEENLDIMLQANVIKPSTLFQKVLQENNCKNYIYASSCSIYGNQSPPFFEIKTNPKPLNAYALSKLQFENFATQFANENKVKMIGLRYSNVYGPNESHKGKRASMVHQIIQKCMNDETIELFDNGEQLRDWVYIDDVIKANIHAYECSKSGIYNVGYGRPYSFNYLAQTIIRITNSYSQIKYIPCEFSEKYQYHTATDLSRSNEDLGFYPEISVPEGVRMML